MANKYPELILKPDPMALYGTPGTVGNAVSLDEKGAANGVVATSTGLSLSGVPTAGQAIVAVDSEHAHWATVEGSGGVSKAELEAAQAAAESKSDAKGLAAAEKARAEAAEVLKAPLASPALTGTPTTPTASEGVNNTQVASTAFAQLISKTERERAEGVEALKAPLASPAFTGNPTVPTQTASDSTTKAASTAFVGNAVSAAINGLNAHPNVRLGTAAALPTNTYNNGTGTLTGVSFGALSVDGSEVKVNDRVLVRSEAEEAHNGLYVVTVVGAVSTLYVLTRAVDMKEAVQVPGAFVFIEEGSTLKNRGYFVSSAGPFTIGTTAIIWSQFTGAGDLTAGTGIVITGNQIAVTSGISTGQATAEANSIPLVQKGAVSGVAELDSALHLPEAQLPLSASVSKEKPLGNITGTVTLNLEEGTTFTGTLTGNVTFKVTKAAARPTEVNLILTQDGTGGRTFAVEGLSWVGPEPTFPTTKGLKVFVSLVVLKTGGEVFGIAGLEGKEGPKGSAGEGVATGGTTGQVLKKKSNTNYDTEWGSVTAEAAGVLPLLIPVTAKSSPVPVGAAAIGEANLGIFSRLTPCYATGKIVDMSIYGGSTKNGNTRIALFDLGTASAKKYTLLWESASVEATTNGWTSMGNPNLSVTAGQQLLAGIMNSGTTQTLGESLAAPGTAAELQLPEGYFPVAGESLPKLTGSHKYAEFKFGTLTEAELTVGNTISFMFIGRIA